MPIPQEVFSQEDGGDVNDFGLHQGRRGGDAEGIFVPYDIAPFAEDPLQLPLSSEAEPPCRQFAADVGASSPSAMRCASCGVSYKKHHHMLLDEAPEPVSVARDGFPF